ncbi:MAG: PEP-CTERM sorting domain-containing protein, partial [Chthoniobacteraceae bacterium]
SLSFNPIDLVMSPSDGTLWMSATDNLVHHVKTDGAALGSFATGLNGNFDGIALAPDNNSLYVTSDSSTAVKHFGLDGSLLGSFNLTSPNQPGFLAVVPAPEPATFALLGLGAVFLAARRRRRGLSHSRN